MSKIDELIQQLCPDGVEYRELGEIEDSGLIKLGRGMVISKKDITETPGDYPVYSSSASGTGEFGRYGKYMFDDERISWSVDGGGRFFYRPAQKYSVTNVSGWLKVNDTEKLNTRYLFYVLDSAWQTKVFDYIKKAHPSVIRNEYKIPIPPLEIQREIVDILDKFTQLEAELAAELEARRKQYEFYRNKLLTFDNANDRSVGRSLIEIKWKTLGEVGMLIRGNGLQKKDFVNEGFPCIHYGQIYTYYGALTDEIKSFVSMELAKKLVKAESGDVIVTNTSENLEDVGKSVVWCGDGEVATGGHATVFKPSEVTGKYFAYYTQTSAFYGEKRKYAKGTKVIDVSAKDMAKIKIPVPPLSEQNRITDLLDKFDTLTNDISVGLPAELAARRKQYEYYRSKLLTFPEKEPTHV